MPYKSVKMPTKTPDLDSLLKGTTQMFEVQLLQTAVSQAKNRQQEYEFKAMAMADDRKIMRRHEIEMIKKFTLSVACVVFFFIGGSIGSNNSERWYRHSACYLGIAVLFLLCNRQYRLQDGTRRQVDCLARHVALDCCFGTNGCICHI